MSAQERSFNRRIPSGTGPFSRLRPTTADPLDSVGLPSKGDTRLNDSKAQENYYAKIVERYVKFCADSGTSQELEKQFASMAISDPESRQAGDVRVASASTAKDKHNGHAKLKKAQPTSDSVKTGASTSANPSASTSATSITSTTPAPAARSTPSPELTTILHAMRKLRESIVATSRRDLFAQHAYIFIIRASILVRHFESYQPALLYLLSSIHSQTPLSPPELHEFVGYLILDLTCRQNDFQAAYAACWTNKFKDRRIAKVLYSLVHDDWVAFWRVQRAVDGHQRALMEWAASDMRMHALKCLGRSYFTAEKTFVESIAAMKWDELVANCNVGWELDGEKVTIRRPKVKK